MVFLVGFSVSAVVVGLAFLATYLADNPHLIPEFSLPRRSASLPGGPSYCPTTRRWRDPATRRFVKTPAR